MRGIWIGCGWRMIRGVGVRSCEGEDGKRGWKKGVRWV